MKKATNTKKYKLLALASLVLAALICLSSCGKSTPKADDASGKIEGTDIEWRFTSSDNTLEISGAGEIPSYKTSSETPWADAMKSIKELEIEEGITAIGDNAFYGASALVTAELPTSLASIGKLSFAYCTSLEDIELPEELSSVGEAAFEACTSLTSVSLGASLKNLGARAFAFCSSLKTARILSPVDINSETFYNCRALASVVLHADVTEEKVAADAFKNTDFTFSKATPYSEIPVTVTVNYVYEDGTPAGESYSKEYSVGTPYSVPSETIDGYEADLKTVTGVASVGGNTHTVTYKEIVAETEPVTEAPTEEPSEEEEEPSYLALIIMAVLLVGIGVGAYFLMKSNKANEEKAKNQNKAKNRKQK